MFFFVLIIPIIDNKLAPMINGTKHAYIAVTEIFSTFFSWERKDEKHLPGLFMKRLVVLFIVKPKRERK